MTNTTRGYWCAALGGVIWGLSGVAGQFLLSVYDASPFWLTGVRMTCAGIVFLILSLRQTRSLGIVVRHPKELITIFVYGIFGLMLNQLSYFFSISYSNAGTATVLQTLCVVMMAVLVCLQRSRLPYGREILSVILAFIGVVLIATHGRITELVLSPQALIWGLLDAASCVVYTLLSINPVRKWGSVVVNAIGMLTGGIFL
ncbi:MAG: DMT family transporter, partial [Megasphaera micronuciformis]|nr:DMT family transporter [Megasphaera micronuciformis]